MAKRTTIDCDKCGDKDVNTTSNTFSVNLETYLDNAGDTDTRIIAFDLCTKCQPRVLQYLLCDLDYQIRARDVIFKLVPNARVEP
jgi:hypothetical protein